MKKQLTKKLSVFIAIMVMFSLVTNAQWTRVSTNVRLTNIGDRVGIGTASPTTKLHVVGTTRLQGATTVVGLTTTTTLKITGGTPGVNKILRSDATGAATWVAASTVESDPQVGANTTNRVPKWNGSSLVTGSIFDNGLIGIGTTAPGYQLHVGGGVIAVDGAAGSSAWDYFLINGSFKSAIGYRASNDALNLYAAGGDRLSINNTSGLVGIWATNPAYKLDVGGRMRIRDDGNSAGIWYDGPATGSRVFAGILDNNTWGVFSSSLGWQYTFRQDAVRFGIGTTTPAYALEVITGDYTAAHIKSGTDGGTTSYIDAGGLTGNIWALYANAATSGYAGYFSGNVYCSATYSGSDERLKENIQQFQGALDKVMKIDVKSYNFKSEYANMNFSTGDQVGFIAQNLETVFPGLVRVNPAKGTEQPIEFKAVNYTGMVPVLTAAIQEQQKQMDAKDARINQLEAKMAEIEQALQNCCSSYSPSKNGIDNTTGADKASLEQNTPNPFSSETTIHYYLPSNSTAVLKVMSLDGKEMLSTPVTKTGYGEVRISGSTMAAGTYTYTLLVNDKAVESKIMVLTK